MALKIGISIYSIPDQSIETLIRFAEKNHFVAIELWNDYLIKKNEWVLKYLKDANIELSVHAPLLNLGEKKFIKQNNSALNDCLERAKRWKAKTVVLHTGIIEKGNVADGVKTAMGIINAKMDILREFGLMLCIENVGYLKNEMIYDFNQLAEFVNKFPKDHVGVTYDIAHANITQGVESGFKILKERIKHVHLSDNNGHPEKHHLPIGKGKIDIELIKKIVEIKDITAILEITPNTHWEKNLLESRSILDKRINQ